MMEANKYTYLWIVQGNYGYGWEDEAASETRKEARDDLKAYRENGPGSYRMIQRRELNTLLQEGAR
tara:strand:+ start:249 stop:446 length:198 start_codon:yes stop_codon:yes gene_type:complete